MLSAILTIILIVGGTALLAWPLGKYLAGLFSGRFARTDGLFARMVGGAPEQDWKQYSFALIAFNIVNISGLPYHLQMVVMGLIIIAASAIYGQINARS